MTRLSNTWQLAKASFALLRKDRELMWLPVLGLLGALLVVLVFAGPVIALTQADSAGSTNPALGWIIGFVGYVAVASVVIFFQAAVVSGAHERMEGGDPTVRSAIQGARQHTAAIVGWAVIAATVSIILDAIEERFGFLGSIVSALAGLAWRVTTFLVLPVVVVEGTGPIEGVKRSAALLKRSFGERIYAEVGFGLLGVVLAIPAVLLAMLLISAGGTAGLVLGVAVAGLYLLAVSAGISALSGIFQVALHRHVTGRPLPVEFDPTTLSAAIHSR